MPRASYGDRHSISVIHGSQQTAFDFTSRVIDFFVICNADPAAGMCWEGAPSLLKSQGQPGVALWVEILDMTNSSLDAKPCFACVELFCIILNV